MPLDDFVPILLCDVKGCHQPQFGEALEIQVAGMTLHVRVNPCPAHYRMMVDGPSDARAVATGIG